MNKVMSVFAALLLMQLPNEATSQSGEKEKAPQRFEYLNAQGKKMTQEETDNWIQRLDSIPTPPPPPKRTLGPIDTWRYESCQQDAATAPTKQGVYIKMRVCREKFGQ